MSTRDGALVLFSGGQDSTTCLAWALDRFAHVETVGFDYGQRHAVELVAAARAARDSLRRSSPIWAERLGPDHTLDMGSFGAIADTAMTRDIAIATGADGLPNTFVPGRNLVFLDLCGGARGAARPDDDRRRHVRDGFLRLSRLPRRHDQGDAGRAQPRHGAAFRDRDAADVAVEGATHGRWRRSSAARRWSI